MLHRFYDVPRLGELLAVNVGALVGLVNQYVFNDWSFAAYLMVLVAVDTATGIYASLVTRTHSSSKLRSVFGKLFQYSAALICGHVLSHHLVDGQPNAVFQAIAPAFKGGLYTLLLWTEVVSVEENLQKVGKGFLPQWLKRKMASWMESGKTDDPPAENKPTA